MYFDRLCQFAATLPRWPLSLLGPQTGPKASLVPLISGAQHLHSLSNGTRRAAGVARMVEREAPFGCFTAAVRQVVGPDGGRHALRRGCGDQRAHRALDAANVPPALASLH